MSETVCQESTAVEEFREFEHSSSRVSRCAPERDNKLRAEEEYSKESDSIHPMSWMHASYDSPCNSYVEKKPKTCRSNKENQLSKDERTPTLPNRSHRSRSVLQTFEHCSKSPAATSSAAKSLAAKKPRSRVVANFYNTE